MTRILETDDSGTLSIPAEMLSERRPHAKYTVEQIGETLHVSPAIAKRSTATDHEARMVRWRELAERISAAWPEGVSAVDAVSEQRR